MTNWSGYCVKKNLDVSQLAGILISHDDIDQMGSFYKFRQSNPELLVYASCIEEPSLAETLAEKLNPIVRPRWNDYLRYPGRT